MIHDALIEVGRRFGNRYRVHSVNLPAYETLIDAALDYYAKKEIPKGKTIKRRIPQRLTPKRRLQRHTPFQKIVLDCNTFPIHHLLY